MKVVADNRRARFDFEILETIEAGIMLTGPEVKSCREGQADLRGAYVLAQGGALILRGMKIAPYRYAADVPDYVPHRERRLLVSKQQMDHLRGTLEQQGLAIIPLEVRAGKYVKVLLGIGRGRKRIDKRHRIKDRDVARRVREGREI